MRQEILIFKAKNKKVKEIDFIINSPGGSPSDAYRIIRTLRNNFEKVNIIVPFWAKSAATLLSLGGTQIVMDEFGEFGPLDIQLAKEREDSPDYDRESALNDEYSLKRIEARSRELFHSMFINLYRSENVPINKNELSKQIFDYIAKFYEPLLKQINPYKLGEKKRKLDIGEQYAQKILSIYQSNIPQEKRQYLIYYLVNECPEHAYVIDFDVISRFLPNVKKSDIFGEEYTLKLTELSNVMILAGGQTNYVGFVLQGEELQENGEAKNADKAATKVAKKSKITVLPNKEKEVEAKLN